MVGTTTPNRRVVITCAAFAAVSSLWLVTNLTGQLRASLAAKGEPLFVVLVLAAPLLAMAALRLYPRTAWAWLLFAGAVLTVPSMFFTSGGIKGGASLGDQLLAVSILTSPTFTLIGLLATATWISRAGMRGVGAVLGGLTVGVPVVGQLLVFPLFAAGDDTVWTVLAVVSVCGAVTLVSMLRAVSTYVASAPPAWRLVIAGAVVTLLPLVTSWADERQWVIISVAVVTLLVAFVGGWRAALGALVVTLAGTATLTPLLQVTFIGYYSLGWLAVAVVAGLLLGSVIAAGRYRVPVAAVGLVVFGVLTLIDPLTLKDMPTAAMIVLVVLLVAVIVAKTGAVTDLLRVDGSAAVAVGVVGASLTSALTLVEYSVMRGENYSVVNPGQPVTVVFGILLIVAAGLLVVLRQRTPNHVP
ncbi:hypothetical protein GCM10029964_074120 [Kibdelosporangium lantanae]